MPISVREINENDFNQISKLFDNTKSINELKWLFRNVNNSSKFDGLVAVNENEEIVGVIGYKISTYSQNGKTVNGVIPYSWKIIENYKGLAGVILMKTVLNYSDFAYAVGGTDKAIALYPLFKLNFLKKGYKYYKIFNLNRFLFSLEGSILKRIAKTFILIPAYLKRINKNRIFNEVKLVQINSMDLKQISIPEQLFYKPNELESIKWLLDCPVLDTYLFLIKNANKEIGYCVFYIIGEGREKRGRIVYLTHLGEDEVLWKSVLYKSFNFFKQKKCNSVTSFCSNKLCQMGYSIGMFKFIKAQDIFIKDSKKILKDFNLDSWDTQFKEGDIGYLSM